MPTDDDASTPPHGPFSERQFKWLRWSVYGMGVLLIVGFLVIIGRIIYLVAQPSPGTASVTEPAHVSAVPSTMPRDAKLALPSGAIVRHISMAGQRLAIQYDAPSGSAIVIYDVATGTVVSRIALVSEN